MLGLLFLTAVSLAAGFTAASFTFDEEAPLETFASLGPGADAATVDLHEGEALEVHVLDDWAPASFAVFDPSDGFHEHLHLVPGEHARIPIDQDGAWVVMPTSGEHPRAALVISTTDAEANMDRVTPIPVSEHAIPLEEHEGSPLEDRRWVVEIDRKPALVRLAVEGRADAFEASVIGPGGVVFEGRGDTVNGSVPLALGPNVTVDPSGIDAGLYQVRADAEALQGRLELVHRSYVRDASRVDLVPEPVPGLAQEGIPVASLSQGEGVQVTAGASGELVLAAEPGTVATARFYDDAHTVRAIVDLGEADGFDWDFGDGEETVETRSVNAEEGSAWTVYASRVDSGGDEEGRLFLLVPGERTAQAAQEVMLQETGFTFEGGAVSTTNSHSVEARLPGGLVDVDVRVDAVAGFEHAVRVIGPLGLVYEHVDEMTLAGERVQHEERSTPGHYSDGAFTVRVSESTTVESTVHVTLVHYTAP